MPTITLRAARKIYPGSGTEAVRGLDLEVAEGEFMCLLGPSGCGKTTTLRMIAGLEALSGGELSIGGRVMDCLRDGIFVPPEKRDLGLVFQSYALWPHLNVERNTDFGLRLRRVPKAERESRVEKVMCALGIQEYRRRYPSQLSGGQQQRVALARMLAVSPSVLLLDEPLSNLDARLRLEMRAELKRIHAEFGTTVVFVTHDQWEAMTLATTIAVMNDGTLLQMGPPEAIYDRPATRYVAEFVGSPPINILDLAGSPRSAAAEAMAAFLARAVPGLGPVGSVGIRPETIRLQSEARPPPDDQFALPARVSGVLPTGGSWIVELGAGGEALFATTHVAPELSAGTPATVLVERAALHLFDTSGARMADADRALGRAAA
jgi:iron(III) transport system ATP-binding protein